MPGRCVHLHPPCIYTASTLRRGGACRRAPMQPMCWSAESLRRGDCVDAVPAAGQVVVALVDVEVDVERRPVDEVEGLCEDRSGLGEGGTGGGGRWQVAEGCGGRPVSCLPEGDVLVAAGVLRPVDQVAPGRLVVWSTPDGAGALPPAVLGPARPVEQVSLVGPVLPVRRDQERSGEVRLGRVRRPRLAVRRGSYAEALARRVLGHEVVDVVGPVLDKGPGVPLGAHCVRLEHQAAGRAGR